MPAGIQIFAPDGALRLDYTDRMFKFFDIASVGQSFTGGQASGIIQHGWFNAFPGNVPFAFVVSGGIVSTRFACQFTFNNDLLIWAFAGASRPDTTFAYGIW